MTAPEVGWTTSRALECTSTNRPSTESWPICGTSGWLLSPGSESGDANYEWIADSNHHHLYCSVCSETFPLDDDLVDRITRDVYEKYGFSADLSHTVLAGTCRQCSDEPGPTK